MQCEEMEDDVVVRADDDGMGVTEVWVMGWDVMVEIMQGEINGWKQGIDDWFYF